MIGLRPCSQEVAEPVLEPRSVYEVGGPLPYPAHSGGGTYRNPKGLMVNFPVGKVTLPS